MEYTRKVNLLVVEAFAGTYGVARQVPTINDDTKFTGVSIGAYAGIEYQQHLYAEAERLTAVRHSLGTDSYLNLCDDLNKTDTRERVIEFMQQQLQTAAGDGNPFDAVIVFGGPPCEAYSKTQLQRTAKYINKAAKRQQQHKAAETKYNNAVAAAALPGLAAGELSQAKAKQQQLKKHLLEADKQHKLACAQLAKWEEEHERRRVEADKLVQNFLTLYKAIEKECHALELAKPPACYLVMENVESIAANNGYKLALWNRDVMAPHLLCLPPIPSAEKLAGEGKFVPVKDAWLRCIKVNWCRYGHNEFPLKPTVIFTNLPTLQTTRCICKGKHATTVAGIEEGSAGANATARAAWPQGFVLRTIWLCAQHVRLAPGVSPSKPPKPIKPPVAAAADMTLKHKVEHILSKLPTLRITGDWSLTKARDIIRSVYDICELDGGAALLCAQLAFVECLPSILGHHCAEIRHGAGDLVDKLAYKRPANQCAIAANKAVRHSVEVSLAPGKNPKLRTAAAKIVRSLAANHPDNQQRLGCDTKFIQLLAGMFKLSNADAVHSALAAVAALTADCPANLQHLKSTPGAQAALLRLQADNTVEMKPVAKLAAALLAAEV